MTGILFTRQFYATSDCLNLLVRIRSTLTHTYDTCINVVSLHAFVTLHRQNMTPAMDRIDYEQFIPGYIKLNLIRRFRSVIQSYWFPINIKQNRSPSIRYSDFLLKNEADYEQPP